MKFKTAIFLTFALCGYSFGNPEGSAVVSGDVDFQTDGLDLNITASDRAIIEWQDFSIDAGETTRFLQPSSNAAVLNQVKSNMPSSIDGNLLGNGNVYLMNPNGIVIGATGVVDTGGFLATTLDQGSSKFFENGELELLGDSDAAIVNMGNITATGDIFLVATKIDNQGLIQSTSGFVGLAAGKDVLLKEAGEERIFIRPVGEGEVLSSGSIEALNIEIKSRGNAFSTAINLGGQVTANKVNEVGGRVFLSADNGDIVLGEDVAISGEDVSIFGAGTYSYVVVTSNDDIYITNPNGITVGNLGFSSNSGLVVTNENSGGQSTESWSGSGSLVLLGNYGNYNYISPNVSNFVVQPITFQPMRIQPTSDPLNSPLFTNFKKDASSTGSIRSPFADNDQNTGLIAQFSAQASDDSKSIINLDR